MSAFLSYLMDPAFSGDTTPIEVGTDAHIEKLQHAGAVAALTGQPLLTKASVRDEWDEPLSSGDGEPLAKRAASGDSRARYKLALTGFVDRAIKKGYSVEDLAEYAGADGVTRSLILEIAGERGMEAT